MVLLDLMLPEVDGFELCRQIRERSPVAIIVVSARGGEQDKVTALNMGADDYMTKPFGIEELLARILATLRRTRPAEAGEPRPSRRSSRSATSSTSPDSRSASPGPSVHLSPTEFALLRELALNRASCCPARTCYAGSGAAATRRRPSTSACTSGGCGPNSSRRGPPLIITQPRAGYRIAGD